ncbi:electron transfer flavoprotein subunit alpha [Halorubrum persicum]|uniref:Electron transfer flavoprotein subunit alpha n=1 Tax=Halorubrum persicum TaxID=1383844 RepID=A0A2G1WHP1_9EURY|nr:electron transfer flavoprotein subunit alpha/FixB family protein [Halorubrum persicum]PHQ38518.1 electron transfer flavoprotein subunit alpha [Halorubrum persicum]
MTVLVIADHRRGDLRDVSFELLTAGRELADAAGTDLHAAVISGNTEAFADELNREGVDTVHAVDYGKEFNHDVYSQAVTELTKSLEVDFLLVPNSVNGLDYAPAVASRVNWPYVSDAVGLDYSDGTLGVTREMYGSKVETTVEIDDGQSVVSIRDAEWPPAKGDGNAPVLTFNADINEESIGSTVTGFKEVGGGEVDISEADFLVSIGRGIEEEENLELVEELVNVTDAMLSASRPVVDNGWLEKNRQVGQSGKKVAPDVYLAIGISGAVQHVAGMKNSETIVAINTDPNAPIFDIADYGIVGDLFDVLPELIKQFGAEPPNF